MRAYHHSNGLHQEVQETEMTSPYFFLFGRCVKAEAATRFTAFGVLGFRRRPDAIVPIRFDVFSFLAIIWPPTKNVYP
jgi:hypothetical protein